MKSDGHKTETPDVSHIRNVEVTHETSDISVSGVLTFVVVLTLATAAVSAGMVALFSYFDNQAAKERPQGPMALKTKEERLPPEPRLQAAPGFQVTTEDGRQEKLERKPPQAEYRVLRHEWDETLNNGAKDQAGNTVGLSIKQAMDQVVSGQGLPTRAKTAPGKLDDYAISMPTAWSSGRETEKKRQ